MIILKIIHVNMQKFIKLIAGITKMYRNVEIHVNGGREISL
jgi:hypothetical protein